MWGNAAEMWRNAAMQGAGAEVKEAMRRSRVSSRRGSRSRPNFRNRGFAQAVKKIVEPKSAGFIDITEAGYNFDTTGSLILLSVIPQGSSTNERIGKRVKLKSLQIRGRVASNASTTTAQCHLLIVYDSKPDGSLPVMSDIIESGVSNPSAALNNDDNSARFRIVRRMNWAVHGNASTAAAVKDTTLFNVDEFLNLKKKKTIYKSAETGAIDDHEQGALYMLTFGSIAPGTTAAAALFTFRLRFIDMLQ